MMMGKPTKVEVGEERGIIIRLYPDTVIWYSSTSARPTANVGIATAGSICIRIFCICEWTFVVER